MSFVRALYIRRVLDSGKGRRFWVVNEETRCQHTVAREVCGLNSGIMLGEENIVHPELSVPKDFQTPLL